MSLETEFVVLAPPSVAQTDVLLCFCSGFSFSKILLRAVNCYDPLSTLIIVTFALVLLYQQIGASFVAMIVGIIFMFVFTPILAKDIGESVKP